MGLIAGGIVVEESIAAGAAVYGTFEGAAAGATVAEGTVEAGGLITWFGDTLGTIKEAFWGLGALGATGAYYGGDLISQEERYRICPDGNKCEGGDLGDLTVAIIEKEDPNAWCYMHGMHCDQHHRYILPVNWADRRRLGLSEEECQANIDILKEEGYTQIFEFPDTTDVFATKSFYLDKETGTKALLMSEEVQPNGEVDQFLGLYDVCFEEGNPRGKVIYENTERGLGGHDFNFGGNCIEHYNKMTGKKLRSICLDGRKPPAHSQAQDKAIKKALKEDRKELAETFGYPLDFDPAPEPQGQLWDGSGDEWGLLTTGALALALINLVVILVMVCQRKKKKVYQAVEMGSDTEAEMAEMAVNVN